MVTEMIQGATLGPPLNICTACSGLSLSITDFVNIDPSGEIRLDAWGTFRKARLGTLGDILSRQDCPICRLAANVIFFKSTGDINYQSPTEYEACLRWEDPIWDREVMKVRRPVFLGFCSDFDRYDVAFVPTMRNATYCEAPTMQYTARHLQTVAEKCVLVQQWLENCIREHEPACSGSHNSVVQQQQHVWDIPNFVLIDVHKQCLVDAPVHCRYAALSYVWGHQPFFNLTQLNVSRLRQPGSFKNHRKLIPKTIADAMHFVRQIGERYLWVDSLCIVQDDSSQKHGLINNMDLIFSSALLTIIAATGKDANAGLFHAHDLGEQIAEGLDLTGIDFFQSRRDQEGWFHETRGWTYQEQLLSKRHVVFADGLTFFVCSKSVWREDLVTEETEIMAGQGEITSSFQRPLQPGNDPAGAISAYISCVEVYSRRNLSFPEDGLNAFAGISKILENDLGTSMFYGLPIKYFELALLWAPKGMNLTRRQGFPTWSWVGWSGGVDISSLRRATDWLRSVGWLKTKNDYEYYDPETASFCSLETYPNSSRVQNTKDSSRMPCLETRLSSDSSVDLAGMIRFRGLCATFSIAVFEQPQRRSDRSNIAIFDVNDNLIGELEDGHEWQLEAMPHLLGVHEVVVISEKLSEPWHYALFPSSYKVNYDSVTSLRSIGSAPDQLRTRGSSLLTPQPSAIPQVRSVRSRLDMKLHKASNWGLLNVMVIEWYEGVAYRLGVGWIFKEALAKSFSPGETWKTVTLG